MNPTVLALIICGAAAIAEGALAGGGVYQRLAQLRMPAYSPPFALWLVIGLLFYAMCFIVLQRLLGAASSGPQLVDLMLLILVLLVNALWNVLFFRWRDLRASFVAFTPYAVVVAALVAVTFSGLSLRRGPIRVLLRVSHLRDVVGLQLVAT